MRLLALRSSRRWCIVFLACQKCQERRLPAIGIGMIKDELFDFFGISATVRAAHGGRLEFNNHSALDFLSQYGASPFGGVHEDLATAATDFFAQPQGTLCQPLKAEHAERLKKKLLSICDAVGGQVILSQGGAETVEVAIKLARAATSRPYTIALEGAFHGKTMGAVQLTANSDYSDYFGIPNDFVRRLSQGNLADLDTDFAALTKDGKVNAVIVEVIKGEGGMIELPPEWLRHLEGLCRASDILFCVDEIQTGLGRTGALLASRDIGLRPDITLLSKALGGGIVPIGACVVAEGVMPPDFTIFHSATFANNNFTSFMACKAIDLIEETLPHTRRVAAYLDVALRALVLRNKDVFSHISGRGLMIGLHLRESHDTESIVSNFQWETGLRSYAVAAWLLREEELLTMPCFSKPSCLRLQPPLTVTRAQVNQAIHALEQLAAVIRGPHSEMTLYGNYTPSEAQAKPRFEPQIRVLPKRTPKKIERRFQFNMHPLHEWSFLNSLPKTSAIYDPRIHEHYLDRQHDLGHIFSGFAAPCLQIDDLEIGDARLTGRLFGINLTADQMAALSTRQRTGVQNVMAKSALQYGAEVMGLGAFTSIISNPGFRRLPSGAVVTPGSSLTAFAAVQAALKTPALTSATRFGVVGAAGSIGALCVQMLLLAAIRDSRVDRITLFSNPANAAAGTALAKAFRRWTKAWAEVDPEQTDDPVAWRGLLEIARRFMKLTTETSQMDTYTELMQRAVTDVIGRQVFEFATSDDLSEMARIDRLLLATNATRELSSLDACKPGAQLYDIGMPSSVSADWIAKSPVTVRTAGIVEGPHQRAFGHGNIVGLPPGLMLGCFAETLTLSATEPQAAPAGPSISLEQAERIGALALSVGITPTVTSAMDCAVATMPVPPARLSNVG